MTSITLSICDWERMKWVCNYFLEPRVNINASGLQSDLDHWIQNQASDKEVMRQYQDKPLRH